MSSRAGRRRDERAIGSGPPTQRPGRALPDQPQRGAFVPFATAEFSPDSRYRYRAVDLHRGGDRITFVVLHPFPGRPEHDPGIRRCVALSRQLRAGETVVGSLYAARVGDVELLRGMVNPVGPENLLALRDLGRRGQVVCAWGDLGVGIPGHAGHVEAAADHIRRGGGTLRCLDVTDSGAPCDVFELSGPPLQLKPWSTSTTADSAPTEPTRRRRWWW